MNVAKGGSLLGRVGQASALGAASGAGFSNEEDVTGIAKDAAIGGVIGGVVQGGIEAVSKAGPGIKNWINKKSVTPDEGPLVSEAEKLSLIEALKKKGMRPEDIMF